MPSESPDLGGIATFDSADKRDSGMQENPEHRPQDIESRNTLG